MERPTDKMRRTLMDLPIPSNSRACKCGRISICTCVCVYMCIGLYIHDGQKPT
jgi:hypothetical protein